MKLEQLDLRCTYYKRLLAAIVADNPTVFLTFKPGEDNPRMIDEVLYIDALVDSETRAARAERQVRSLRIRGQELQQACDDWAESGSQVGNLIGALHSVLAWVDLLPFNMILPEKTFDRKWIEEIIKEANG